MAPAALHQVRVYPSRQSAPRLTITGVVSQPRRWKAEGASAYMLRPVAPCPLRARLAREPMADERDSAGSDARGARCGLLCLHGCLHGRCVSRALHRSSAQPLRCALQASCRRWSAAMSWWTAAATRTAARPPSPRTWPRTGTTSTRTSARPSARSSRLSGKRAVTILSLLRHAWPLRCRKRARRRAEGRALLVSASAASFCLPAQARTDTLAPKAAAFSAPAEPQLKARHVAWARARPPSLAPPSAACSTLAGSTYPNIDPNPQRPSARA
jgi:hypothetical protein